MKKEKSFLSGALVLSLGGLLAKVLGALYRIPLTNILGSYGMGLYQLVFPPYILFLTVAQAGVPVALSKLIAQSNQLDNKIQGRKYFKFAFGLLLCFGIISALFMAVLSTFIAKAQGNVDTAMAFVLDGAGCATSIRWQYPLTHINASDVATSGGSKGIYFAFNMYADGDVTARICYAGV